MTACSVRNRLQQVLPDAVSFEAFCCDHFPAVYRRFGAAMDRQSQTTLLLSHHSPQEIGAALLRWQQGRAPVPSLQCQEPSQRLNSWKLLVAMVATTVCVVGILLVRLGMARHSAVVPPQVTVDSAAIPVVDMVAASAFSLQTVTERSPPEQSQQVVTGTVQAQGSSTIVIGNQNHVSQRVFRARK